MKRYLITIFIYPFFCLSDSITKVDDDFVIGARFAKDVFIGDVLKVSRLEDKCLRFLYKIKVSRTLKGDLHVGEEKYIASQSIKHGMDVGDVFLVMTLANKNAVIDSCPQLGDKQLPSDGRFELNMSDAIFEINMNSEPPSFQAYSCINHRFEYQRLLQENGALIKNIKFDDLACKFITGPFSLLENTIADDLRLK
jgi:hypothetical protein